MFILFWSIIPAGLYCKYHLDSTRGEKKKQRNNQTSGIFPSFSSFLPHPRRCWRHRLKRNISSPFFITCLATCQNIFVSLLFSNLLEEQSGFRGIVSILTLEVLVKNPKFEIHHSAVLETHFGTLYLKIL